MAAGRGGTRGAPTGVRGAAGVRTAVAPARPTGAAATTAARRSRRSRHSSARMRRCSASSRSRAASARSRPSIAANVRLTSWSGGAATAGAATCKPAVCAAVFGCVGSCTTGRGPGAGNTTFGCKPTGTVAWGCTKGVVAAPTPAAARSRTPGSPRPPDRFAHPPGKLVDLVSTHLDLVNQFA